MKHPDLLPPSQDQLPMLWQKPAYKVLLASLEKLRVKPRAWNPRVSVPPGEYVPDQQAASAHDRHEVLQFLSGIIKSSLAWLDSDEQENVWDEASKRMSERCGRTAMGEMTRTWDFQSAADGSFSLEIREPPLTGDSLGHKTWGSSYALAQLLHEIAAGPLAHLFLPGAMSTPEEVLELGSGTGLLGLAAACIWKTSVVLTDLPTIVANLAHNTDLNREVVEARGGRAEAASLTWGGLEDDSDPRFRVPDRYQLVIVADPLYDDNHPALLASAIDEQLALNTNARLLVMVPQRDGTTERLLGLLREELAALPSPLVCLEESIVHGQDDWGDELGHDETQAVGFWWGVFGRA